MAEKEQMWEGVEPSHLAALIDRAPVSMAILSGPEGVLRAADSRLANALSIEARRGKPIRDTCERLLGPEWATAIDAARTEGRSHQGTCTIAGDLWELWIEPLGDGAVALYGREILDEKRTRELLHQLRNPIYGIRAAVKILMGRDLDRELREVLAHIETAADQAEQHVRALERRG